MDASGSRGSGVDLYSYIDIAKYLQDLYEEKKRQSPAFSYRSFSRRVGLNSPNHLKRVIDGERLLTEYMAPRYAKALDLDANAIDYFCLLAAFSRAKTLDEKNRVYRKIAAHRGYQQAFGIDASHAEFGESWYMPAIREMAFIPGFTEDPVSLASRLLPPIEPEQARRALEVLTRVGMLARDETGRLVPSDAIIASGPEVSELSLANFFRSMMLRASAAIDLLPEKDRQFTGLTFAIDPEGIEELRRRVEAFRREVIEFAVSRSSGQSQVVQFNMQLFPLTLDLGRAAEVFPENNTPPAEGPAVSETVRRTSWWATIDAPPLSEGSGSQNPS